MTLVVRTRNQSAPMMVGDLLLTQVTQDAGIILPSIGRDISNFLGARRPVGLAQKVYILADNICIAFTSNDIREITNLLEDFRPFCRAGLTPEDIREKVKDHDYSRYTQTSFLMSIVENQRSDADPDQRVLEIAVGCGFLHQQGTCFEDYRPAGSGAGDYTSIVEEKKQIITSFDDDDPRQGIVRNGAFIARFLAEERYFLRTLDGHWGGGYEIVFYNGQRFEKLDNFAIVLQTGKFCDSGEVDVKLPMMINHYRYQGEDLVITGIEILNLSTRTEGDFLIWTSNSVRVGCMTVPQLNRGVAKFGTDRLPIESFETNKVGVGLAIEFQAEWFKPSFYHGDNSFTVSYSQDTKRAEIRIHQSAQRRVEEMFRSSYARLSKS